MTLISFLLSILFLLVLWFQGLNIFRYLNLISPKRIGIKEFVAAGNNSKLIDNGCIHCGNIGLKEEYREGKFSFSKCESCGMYLVNRNNAFNIFHRFAPEFKNLTGEYVLIPGRPGFYSLYGCVTVHDEKGEGYFQIDEVDQQLGINSERVRDDVEGKYLVRWVKATLVNLQGDSETEKKPFRPVFGYPLIIIGLFLITAFKVDHLQTLFINPTSSNFLWKGKRLNVFIPEGWEGSSFREKNDSAETIQITLNNFAAVTIKHQCWNILLEPARKELTEKILGNDQFTVGKKDAISKWGKYSGVGNSFSLLDKNKNNFTYNFFINTEKSSSFVVHEVLFNKYIPKFRADLDSIRNSAVMQMECVEEIIDVDTLDEKAFEKMFGKKI